MRIVLVFVFALLSFSSFSQEQSEAEKFWGTLSIHLGKAYEGVLVSPESAPGFEGKLVMHVRSSKDDVMRIPFFVGDDRSRTWVLTKNKGVIKLKHDHRHEDGSEDEVTQYGGLASNTGFANMQVFPADQETTELIPYAAGNVWWITIDENSFTYNLRRLGSDTLFSVKFDLTTPVDIPEAPWGWVD